MAKIMVSGALGNVGGYVASQAIKNGQEVVVADINKEALEKKYGEKATVVHFDFTDPDTFDQALKNVDRVFIMRPPHLGKADDLKAFIEALKNQGKIRLVCFLSLIGIENNPFPPHYKIEKYIEKAGLPFCHMRPSFFMQNISGVHAFEIKHFDRIVVPVKKARTSFIDAADVGEMTARVLAEPERHTNTAYSITGPEALDYDQLAEIFSQELGRQIVYTNPRPSLARKYWTKIRGLDQTYVKVMAMLYMMTRLGTASQVSSTFEALMDKKPQTFREFVRKNLMSWEN